MAQLERTPDPKRERTSKAAIVMDRAPRIVAIGRLGSPDLFALFYIILLLSVGRIVGDGHSYEGKVICNCCGVQNQ